MLYRFGKFELLADAGELRKAGALVHLQPQPLRVLLLLASRGGEVVTRDEIRSAVWGAETFVDYEQGVNTAIRQIRRALNDTARDSRMLQTVPRHGYRFIAPVERVVQNQLIASLQAIVPAPRPAPARRYEKRAVILGLVTAVAIGAAAALIGWRRRR